MSHLKFSKIQIGNILTFLGVIVHRRIFGKLINFFGQLFIEEKGDSH